MVAAIPAMPIKDAPETAFAVYTALMALITGGFLVWWLVSERRHGPALPLLILGGALSGLMEPWLDNIVLYRWPPHQNLAAFEAFGRTIPWFVLIGYGWYCGALPYVTARYLRRGFTANTIWALLGIIVVIDFLAIGLSAWLDVSGFFGDPPLRILGYPLWWAAIDGLHVILAGSIALLLIPHLRGWTLGFLVVLPSMALGASTGIVAWPVSIAINSQWPDPAKYLCAFATIGLSLAAVWGITRVLPALVRASENARPGVGVLEGPERLERLGPADAPHAAEPVEH